MFVFVRKRMILGSDSLILANPESMQLIKTEFDRKFRTCIQLYKDASTEDKKATSFGKFKEKTSQGTATPLSPPITKYSLLLND